MYYFILFYILLLILNSITFSLYIYIPYNNQTDGVETDAMMANTYVVQSKLHLVDLAGSERVKRTLATGVRLKESVG